MQIGVDIEDIKRFESKTLENDSNFLNHIYTQNELDYCFSFAHPAQHLAARFCAKEAVVKALTNVCSDHISYNEIEVLKRENDSPYINILKNGMIDNSLISLSLSHDRDKAIAFVVVQD